MNRCRIENNTIYFQPFDGGEIEVCKVEEISIVDRQFVYSGQCYPLDERFETEFEILKRWIELFPNGRPIIEISVKKTYSEMDMLWDAIAVMNGVEVRSEDV